MPTEVTLPMTATPTLSPRRRRLRPMGVGGLLLTLLVLHESQLLGVSLITSSASGRAVSSVVVAPKEYDPDKMPGSLRSFWVPIGSLDELSDTQIGKSVHRHLIAWRAGSPGMDALMPAFQIESASLRGPVWLPLWRSSSSSVNVRFMKVIDSELGKTTLLGRCEIEHEQATWGIRSTLSEIDAAGHSIAQKVIRYVEKANAPAE